jgi:hypothetical protein
MNLMKTIYVITKRIKTVFTNYWIDFLGGIEIINAKN